VCKPPVSRLQYALMIRLKTLTLTIVALLASVPRLPAQLSKIAVVDFEGAVVQSDEGKKASDKFNAAVQAKQAQAEKRQKEIDDLQKKLENGKRTLNPDAQRDIQRDIDRKTTDQQRFNQDAQSELQTLRDELLRPIAERATKILNALSAEENYTVVVDVSNPDSNVIWFDKKNDITEELIKRINAATPKEPVKSEAPKPTTPAPAPKAPTPPAPKSQ
jgi:outer membrane protein